MKQSSKYPSIDGGHIHSRDMIYKIDIEGRFTFVNPVFAEFFSGRTSNLIGQHFSILVRKDYRERVQQFYVDQLNRKLPSTYLEFPALVDEKQEVWIGQSVEAIMEQGEVVEFLAVGHDITERVQANLSLRNTEARYRHIIDNINLGLIEVDLEDHIVFANAPFCRLVGYELDQLIGKSATRLLVAKEDRNMLPFGTLYQTEEEALAYEARLTASDMTGRWVIISSAPIRNKHNEIVGALCVHHNISGRKQQEINRQELLEEVESRNEDLRRKQNYLTAINDFAAKLIKSSTLEDVLREISESAVNKFGFNNCHIYLLGEDVNLVKKVSSYPEHANSAPELVNRGEGTVGGVAQSGLPDLNVGKGESAELAIPVIADGEILGVIYSRAEAFGWDELQTLTTLSNLSANKIRSALIKLKRQEAERALRENETRLRSILNSALDAMITIDEEGLVREWNPRAEEIFGFSAEEAIGNDLGDLIVPEKYRAAHHAGMKHFLKYGDGPILNKRIEIHGQHKDGRYFPVELSIVPIKMGKHYIFSAFLRDITLKKKAEDDMETALQKQKELAQLKSRLIAMTSHEFRTPLTTIKSSVDLLMFLMDQEKIRNVEKVEKNMKRINFEIDRLNTLVNDILMVGKLESGSMPFKPAPTDIVDLVENLISNSFGSDANGRSVNLEVSGKKREMFVDENLYTQIFSNLISNALKYSPKGPQPQVHLIFQEEELVIRVKDEGIGIPKREQQRLFESFYRASNSQKFPGHGMGLAIVKQFLDLHKASIQVFSDEYEGTEIVIVQPYNH